MADHRGFCEFPDEILLHILCNLDYVDIVSVSSTCKRLKVLCRSDIIWKPLSIKYWGVSNCPPHLAWWDIFCEWFRDYGRYIDVYKILREAWDKIEDTLDENFPDIFESIQDGLSEAELDAIEREIKQPLPNDLRCVYRIHNGQDKTMACMGMFGALQVYNILSDIEMLDLKTALLGFASHPQFTGCLPITRCKYSGSYQFLALSNEQGYIPGQVFVPAQNMWHYLHQEGSSENVYDDFILANNFMDYFTDFANNLFKGSYPNVNGKLFRFLPNPDTKLKTRAIEVDVATCFCPEQSYINPPEYMHAYRITLTMPEDAPSEESCQLQTRHWIITDENGKEERVDGPGVVGEYPVMKPGTDFSWISCTSFQTTRGSMGGYFTMRNLSTGNTFELKCPTFHMKCLPFQTATDRQANMQREKKNV